MTALRILAGSLTLVAVLLILTAANNIGAGRECRFAIETGQYAGPC